MNCSSVGACCHLNLFFNLWTQSVFPFNRSFYIPFSEVLQLSVYESYTSFVKFIPKYFILVYYKNNWEIIFLILFLNCSLLECRDIIDLYMLILYPATLLNSFISFNSMCVHMHMYFPIYKIISSANRDRFSSSFKK